MKVNGIFFNPKYIEKFANAKDFSNSILSSTYDKDLLTKVWNIHNENNNRHGEQLEAVEHIGSNNTDFGAEQPEHGASEPTANVSKPKRNRKSNNARVQPEQSEEEGVQES
jgi:hypothetical protein